MFDLETNFVGEEKERQKFGASKDKGRARTNLLLSAFDKGDGDSVLLDNLEGMCLRDSAWKEVVDNNTDNDEQGSVSVGANLTEGHLRICHHPRRTRVG